jgi:predicted phage terminase large subunit-like protein
MTLGLDEYCAFLRMDFVSFIERSFIELNPQTKFLHNWHIEVIANALESCRRGETRRLIINVPPRSLKSHCVSVAFVAWLLGHNPSTQIIAASYAQDLAAKHALDCRRLMMSEFFGRLFPATKLSSEKHALSEFVTTQNGSRMATSVGGVLTGRGGDVIILDDPLKPDEALSNVQRKSVNEWFDNTLSSRLNDKRNGCIILVMQRLHQDDLVGHVLEHGVWDVLRFPAIAEEDECHEIKSILGPQQFKRRRGEALHPEREPLATLAQLRAQLGEYNFASQYQQSPAPAGGGLVKRVWFRIYKNPRFEWTFQSWDTASKVGELNDFSVCTTWGVTKKDLYLLHVLRARLEFPDLKRAIHQQAAQFHPNNILIEDKASGTQLIQDLIYERVPNIRRYEPKLDKIMRMHSVTSEIENGFVFLPEKADWLPVYLDEITTFPNSKYDDQADSTSQALDWFKGLFRNAWTVSEVII